MNDLVQENIKLRNQLDEARAEIEYYKSLFTVAECFPDEFKLTPDQGRVLSRLKATHGVCSVHLLLKEIQAEDRQSNLIRVHVCRIKKKLNPYGIKIRTIREFGYMMDIESRSKLNEMVRAA